MVLFVYQISCLCVLIMMISRLIFDKIPLLLDVQRVCQLNTLLAVILHFGKGIMFWFSYLLLGFDGLGLFLFPLGLALTMHMWNWTLVKPQKWSLTGTCIVLREGGATLPNRVL